ncbi:MAG: hypothetical protein QG625_1291 [Cyanobacteriota bacterium erpe_2018_sw_39hr_WHONDRS-SW48-000098_B_bin.30]|jgi:hypothetical protein|nr:hypothetical protein [Cyanobacteriota bacterium erpe_2018_sw_39hr_WHONDRS-SW48-000098_B_bin.30]
MDALKMRSKLHDIAVQALLFDINILVNNYVRVQESSLSADIKRLAARYGVDNRGDANQSLPAGTALGQLFEPDVVEYLLSLPSYYWFWQVVLGATVPAADKQGNAAVLPRRIGMDEVVKAVDVLRRQYSGKYDLSLPLTALAPAQVGSRVAQGLLLVHRVDGAMVIVPNPIFASPDLSLLH